MRNLFRYFIYFFVFSMFLQVSCEENGDRAKKRSEKNNDDTPSVPVDVTGTYLTGAVTDQSGKDYIADAQVFIQNHFEQALTDGEGKFRIEFNYNKDEGEGVTLVVFKENKVFCLGIQSKKFNPEDSNDVGELKIKPCGSIVGNLKTLGTKAKNGVNVYLRGTSFFGTTDEDGNYNISKVPEGTWDIKADQEGFKDTVLPKVEVKANKEVLADQLVMLPAEAAMFGAISINDDSSLTISKKVSVKLYFSENVTAFRIAEDETFYDVFYEDLPKDNLVLEDTYTHTLDYTFANVGEKTLYVQFKNALDEEYKTSAKIIVSEEPNLFAKNLDWQGSFPTNIMATWIKAANKDLANQKIQFYRDGTCQNPIGLSINLNSKNLQSYRLNNANKNYTYSFKITSIDSNDLEIASTCSPSSPAVDSSAPCGPCVASAALTDLGQFGGSFGSATLVGTKAYVTKSMMGLEIYDLSNILTPQLLGRSYGFGSAIDVVVEGNYAYLASEHFPATTVLSSLSVIDISNPAKPQQVANYTPNPQVRATALTKIGNYIYLYCGLQGLVILDVTTPLIPTLVRKIPYSSTFYPMRGESKGNYLYMAGGDAGFITMDITDPTNPSVVNRQVTGTSTYDVKVSGNYAYVVDFYNGLYIYDLSTPNVPAKQNASGVGGANNYYVSVNGSYAYLAMGNSDPALRGTKIYDISTPASPVAKGKYDLVAPVRVGFTGNYLTMGAGVNGLHIVDVSNKMTPTLAATTDTGTASPYGLSVSGNYAYVADYSMAFHVIDVSDPANMVAVGSISADWNGTGVTGKKGNYVYVAAISDIWPVNVANPANPILGSRVSAYTGESVFISNIVLDGDYLYTASTTDWSIYSISSPASPTLKSRISGSFVDVAIKDQFAYLAANADGLKIYNISNPESPSLISSLANAKAISLVAVSGNRLYASEGTGIIVIDITTPSQPTVLGRYSPTYSITDLVADGNCVFASVSDFGIYVFDTYDPANISIKQTFPGPVAGRTEAYRIVADNGKVYVSQGSGGIYVLGNAAGY